MKILDFFRGSSPSKTKMPSQEPGSGRSIRYGDSGRSISDIVNSGSLTTVSDPSQAIKFSEYYSSANMIANSIATLSRNFYRRDPNTGINEKLSQDTFDQVFLWKQMMYPGLVPSKVIKAWVYNLCVGGNGYLIINRHRTTRRPMSYIIREYDRMHPFTDAEGHIWYYDRVQKIAYHSLDVLHLSDTQLDPVSGKAKTDTQGETLGRSKAANIFVNKYFTKGLFLGGVIEYPETVQLTDPIAEAIEKEMNAMYGSVDKSGQIGLISAGGKLKQLKTDVPIGESGYIESEKNTKNDIRSWFSIPTEIKDENTLTQYYNNAILPIIRMIEEEVSLKVIPYDMIGTVYLKFEVDSILRADVKTRAEVLQTYLRNSILTINEVRELMDKAPIEGGDKPLVMANNLVPLSELEEFVQSKIK